MVPFLIFPLTQEIHQEKKKRCLVTKIGKDLFTQALKNLMIISITIDEKISFQER